MWTKQTCHIHFARTSDVLGQVNFVINTTAGRHAIEASFAIRRACIDYSLPCLTESDAAEAFVLALEKAKTGRFEVSHLSF